MIAVDTNILVYACNETSPMHERALAAMDRLVSEPAWGLPWIVAGEFYSTLTNGRQWREPQVDAALAALDAWLATPGARLLGLKVHDARIAAVCLAAGVSELWSTDGDFGWYPELRVRNPLVG